MQNPVQQSWRTALTGPGVIGVCEELSILSCDMGIVLVIRVPTLAPNCSTGRFVNVISSKGC